MTRWALSAKEIPGITLTLSAVDVAHDVCTNDGGELVDAGDGTLTCLECGRNGYPVKSG